MLKNGDQAIYKGHLYWVAFTITMSNGVVYVALRQSHWPKEHHIIVPLQEVLPDIPYAA